MEREVYIFKLRDTYITNDKTGEVMDYVVVSYLTKIGNHIEPMQCYLKAKYRNVVEKYSLKWCKATFEEKLQENSIKLYLASLSSEKCR